MLKNILLLFIPLFLQAQFIGVKTIPLASGEQFMLFPSSNHTIGNLSIALDDEWGDPFLNPAITLKNNSSIFYVLPVFSYITNNLGGTNSLPFGFVTKNERWFGSAVVSYQQLNGASISGPINFFNETNSDFEKTERHTDNKYLYFSAGTFINQQLSAGISVFLADLQSLSGVDLLYANSQSIKEDGSMVDLRTGLKLSEEDLSWEILAFYRNFEMLHDVYYRDFVWDEFSGNSADEYRRERNLDYTDTWGAQIRYKEKVRDDGLNMGLNLTANWKTHPKIPNYEIMNIPRDPGNSWAFDLGLGLGNENDKGKYGFEFTYQPIWSYTWAEAADDIDLGNRIIKAGDRTVENDFNFSNWIMRLGLMRKLEYFSFGGGVQLYKYNYTLTQDDNINLSRRSQEEDWLELTWTWGLSVNFKKFNVSYTGQLITGTGIPGVNNWFIRRDFARFAEMSNDFIVAPSGELNLEETETITHRFILQIPLSN